MRHVFRAALALAALLPSAALAQAQTAPTYQSQAGDTKDSQGVFFAPPTLSCNQANARQFCALATANVASSAVTAFGGTYILAQICTGYGTLAVRVLGPDGTTQEIMASKTSADTTGGTTLSLGAGAVVSLLLTGTTACNATLSRVPGM